MLFFIFSSFMLLADISGTAKFTVTGGEITNNTGVYCASNCKFLDAKMELTFLLWQNILHYTRARTLYNSICCIVSPTLPIGRCGRLGNPVRIRGFYPLL